MRGEGDDGDTSPPPAAPAWDSSTKIARLESRNLLSWRVPHETDETCTASKPVSLTPRAYSTGSSPGLLHRHKVKLLQTTLAQLLESARVDAALADDLHHLLDKATRDVKQSCADHRREAVRSRRPFGTSPKKNTTPKKGLASTLGSLRRSTGRLRPLSSTVSSSSLLSQVKDWNDEEEMDFSVPPEDFCRPDPEEDPEGSDVLRAPNFEVETDASDTAEPAEPVTPPSTKPNGLKLCEARTPPAPLTRPAATDDERRPASEPSMTPLRSGTLSPGTPGGEAPCRVAAATAPALPQVSPSSSASADPEASEATEPAVAAAAAAKPSPDRTEAEAEAEEAKPAQAEGEVAVAGVASAAPTASPPPPPGGADVAAAADAPAVERPSGDAVPTGERVQQKQQQGSQGEPKKPKKKKDEWTVVKTNAEKRLEREQRAGGGFSRPQQQQQGGGRAAALQGRPGNSNSNISKAAAAKQKAAEQPPADGAGGKKAEARGQAKKAGRGPSAEAAQEEEEGAAPADAVKEEEEKGEEVEQQVGEAAEQVEVEVEVEVEAVAAGEEEEEDEGEEAAASDSDDEPPALGSDAGSDLLAENGEEEEAEEEEDDEEGAQGDTHKGLTQAILATLSPNKDEGVRVPSCIKKKVWLTSPQRERIDPDKSRERQERAAAYRDLMNKEKKYKLVTQEERYSAARHKQDALSEKKQREGGERHDAAEARAALERRRKEERARASNERVQEKVFLWHQQRGEKAFELQEKMKRKEVQLARVDEAKRMEAMQRERKAEEYAKKVAGLREAANERDELASRKHQDKMNSSAVNRAKELERIKTKAAEQSQARQREKKAEVTTKRFEDVVKDLLGEETSNRKKRMSRITLTMEKLSQEFLQKELKSMTADMAKSRLAKQLNRLKPILTSGRLAQSKGVLSEIAAALHIGEKVSRQGTRELPHQEVMCFRLSGGIEMLVKLLAEDSKQSEEAHLAGPIGAVLQSTVVADEACAEHCVRSAALLGCIDVLCSATESTVAVQQAFFSVTLKCLRFASTDRCVADVRNAIFSYADVCGLAKLAYASLSTLRTPLTAESAQWVYTAVQVLTVMTRNVPNSSEAWLATLVEAAFSLLSHLLLPLSLQTAKTRVTVPLSSATYSALEEEAPVQLPPSEVLGISLATLQLLNAVARQDVDLVQRKVKEVHAAEFLHISVHLTQAVSQNSGLLGDTAQPTLDTLPLAADAPSSVFMRPLLHELLLFMGYFAFSNRENQELFRWGKAPLLCLLCNLPVQYFSAAALKSVLFPTLVILSYGEPQNRAVLQQELNLCALLEYVSGEIEGSPDKATPRSAAPVVPAKEGEGAAPAPLKAVVQKMLGAKFTKLPLSSFYSFARRFPPAQWRDAVEFFTE